MVRATGRRGCCSFVCPSATVRWRSAAISMTRHIPLPPRCSCYCLPLPNTPRFPPVQWLGRVVSHVLWHCPERELPPPSSTISARGYRKTPVCSTKSPLSFSLSPGRVSCSPPSSSSGQSASSCSMFPQLSILPTSSASTTRSCLQFLSFHCRMCLLFLSRD